MSDLGTEIDNDPKCGSGELTQSRVFYAAALTPLGIMVLLLIRKSVSPIIFADLVRQSDQKSHRVMRELRRLQDYGLVDCWPGYGWFLSHDFGYKLVRELCRSDPTGLTPEEEELAAACGKAFARAYNRLRRSPSYRLRILTQPPSTAAQLEACRILIEYHMAFQMPLPVIEAMKIIVNR
jgi:hypothetical protein